MQNNLNWKLKTAWTDQRGGHSCGQVKLWFDPPESAGPSLHDSEPQILLMLHFSLQKPKHVCCQASGARVPSPQSLLSVKEERQVVGPLLFLPSAPF